MDIYEAIRKKPFYLDDAGVDWVKDALSKMTLEEKVGQLFLLCATEGTREEFDHMFSVMQPCGVMYRLFDIERAVEATAYLKQQSKIPMLIASNLEKGGNGIVTEGTMLGSPMAIAATGDVEMARKLGRLCGREGAAVGANWAFAPIIDIDYNFRNPITNTRTFGSNPDTVRDFGVAYVEEVQKCGLAASIKHFPGDGCDERDQHLVTSINDMDCEEWDRTFGEVYRACIEAGAMTVMVGHIMQPAWTKRINPDIADEDILPASLSEELKIGLLRNHLGFNGLIVTDATVMAGFTIAMPRYKAVPHAIASGADIFLFSRNIEEDFTYMMDGVKSGIISPERLEEALVRILALKAALRLHEDRPLPTLESARAIIGCEEHRAWAKECADKSVTLVKEQPGVLPITPQRYPRILYCPIEGEAGYVYTAKAGVCDEFKKRLEDKGFKVTTFVPSKTNENKVTPHSYYRENFDLVIYCANLATKSNQTTVRIEWQQPMGANCPHYLNEIPTVFVSVENPYHLLDVPRIKTFINAYCSLPVVLDAIIDKLMQGSSAFKGKSPVDPFCGKWDTRL